MTHRDPVEVLASEASLHATLRRLFTTSVDPIAVGREISECMQYDVRRGLEARDAGLAHPTQFFDVVYADVLRDAIGVVRRIEEKLGVASHICFEPQIVGALGAALFARGFLERNGSSGR